MSVAGFTLGVMRAPVDTENYQRWSASPSTTSKVSQKLPCLGYPLFVQFARTFKFYRNTATVFESSFVRKVFETSRAHDFAKKKAKTMHTFPAIDVFVQTLKLIGNSLINSSKVSSPSLVFHRSRPQLGNSVGF